MINKTKRVIEPSSKKNLPDIRPGDTVCIYQKIKEKDTERIQPFKGVVLARKHGKGISATITVRKVVSGIGVERIFPLHSPIIEKNRGLKRGKVKRAKLYYLRKAKGKKARLKRIEIKSVKKESQKETIEKLEEKLEKAK